jgi:hypothetical protein
LTIEANQIKDKTTGTDMLTGTIDTLSWLVENNSYTNNGFDFSYSLYEVSLLILYLYTFSII